jgi:hypothetical protein
LLPTTSESSLANASVKASRPRAAWVRDIFSFPVMCMFLLIAVICKYSIRGIDEPDIWWHLRDARTLLEQHIFLRSDTYSFTAAGSPWINFEWLSEVPYYVGFKTAGLQGLLMVYFAVLVVIYVGVYYRSWRAGADCKDAAIATLAAICLGGVSIAPRMLLFGWLCLMGLLLVLDHFKRTGRGLWLLPPLFMLWINLHGSWVFGFVVLGATIAAGFVEGDWGLVVARRWSASELKKLVIATVVSAAALFVNPFGYRLVLYPFDLLFRQQGVMQYIEEWQPVDFSTINGKLALVVIFAVLASTLFSRRRWALDEVMLTVFALWVALSHARFMFFAGLIIAPILAPDLKLFPPYERELDKPWLNGAIIASIIGAMVYLFPSNAQLTEIVDAVYPRAALEFMQKQHIKGRIFNRYGWGGYMEWNAPGLETGIDGRADIFVYNGVFNDFLNAMALKHSFETLNKYHIDYVLIQPKQPMTYLLEHSPDWRSIYADQVAVLFEHTSPSAQPQGAKAPSTK